MSCHRTKYIKGSAQHGTEPSVYDPANIMGGAQYGVCGKPDFKLGQAGRSLCKEHYQEEQKFLEKIGK